MFYLFSAALIMAAVLASFLAYDVAAIQAGAGIGACMGGAGRLYYLNHHPEPHQDKFIETAIGGWIGWLAGAFYPATICFGAAYGANHLFHKMFVKK